MQFAEIMCTICRDHRYNSPRSYVQSAEMTEGVAEWRRGGGDGAAADAVCALALCEGSELLLAGHMSGRVALWDVRASVGRDVPLVNKE